MIDWTLQPQIQSTKGIFFSLQGGHHDRIEKNVFKILQKRQKKKMWSGKTVGFKSVILKICFILKKRSI